VKLESIGLAKVVWTFGSKQVRVIKMNPRLLSLSYEIYVTVKVIKDKLISVILKERKGFHARVLVQNFLRALK